MQLEDFYKKLFYAMGLSLFLNFAAGADSNDCQPLTSVKAVVDCAMSKHPDIVRSGLSLKQSGELEGIARQIPNPEFSSKGVYGKNLGDNAYSTEFNLTQTLEIGGKRGSRIDKALASRDLSESEFLKEKEHTFTSVLKTLYRIRQVHSEIRVVNEALETFSKIQRQYKSRPRLNPEQEVSASIFQLAEGDYKLKKASLETEEIDLERGISIAIGTEFPHNDKVLPTQKQTWPDVSEKLNNTQFKGSSYKLFQSDLKLAQAELSLAKSESWPELKLGPSIQTQTEGPISYTAYGFNVSLTIPLFHMNGSGRDYARAGLMRAEQNFNFGMKELDQRRSVLFQQYQKSTKALKESVSTTEMERKHRNVEKLFERGVLSSSLVIEAHRQMVDFTSSQNEHELKALEALWEIYALEGKLFEVSL